MPKLLSNILLYHIVYKCLGIPKFFFVRKIFKQWKLYKKNSYLKYDSNSIWKIVIKFLIKNKTRRKYIQNLEN